MTIERSGGEPDLGTERSGVIESGLSRVNYGKNKNKI